MTSKGGGHPGSCAVCGQKLKRNGRTSAGRTRWRCTSCGASSTRSRSDVTRRSELERFVHWLLTSRTQTEVSMASARTFRRVHAWCWNVEPAITITGEFYDQVQLDGIYLSGGWCCLIAITGGKVIGWQWCDHEKKAAWIALLQRIAPPKVVVVDGGSGLDAALAEHWPAVRIQRCLVHVQRNVRTYLTTRPRTSAGKTLWKLALALTKVASRDEAIRWLQTLEQWHQTYGELTRQRTYLSAGVIAPSWVRAGQRWWYTHDRLRKAYRLLEKLARQQRLFTYLDPKFDGLTIDATTNVIEGGINAGLRDLLRRHRGMPTEHRRRAIEWWLYMHSLDPAPTASLIRPEHYQHPARPIEQVDDDRDEPLTYGTATIAEEGLWARRGWAGHT